MTRSWRRRTIEAGHLEEDSMATLLAPEVKNGDWSEPPPSTAHGALSGRAGWMLLVGLALLGAFVAFMVNDYPLRALIAAN
jgi:hypothetical protein